MTILILCAASGPEEYGLCLQHTLKHLSRLSNTVLSEDACACLATGELPPGMAEPSSEQKQLTEEEHAELASESQELAARLPKINLGTTKEADRCPAHDPNMYITHPCSAYK